MNKELQRFRLESFCKLTVETEEDRRKARLAMEEELLPAMVEAYWEEEKELEENGYIDCGCDHDCCCYPEYYHDKLKRELEEKGLI